MRSSRLQMLIWNGQSMALYQKMLVLGVYTPWENARGHKGSGKVSYFYHQIEQFWSITARLQVHLHTKYFNELF